LLFFLNFVIIQTITEYIDGLGEIERKNSKGEGRNAVKNQICLEGKRTLLKAGSTCGGFFTRKKASETLFCLIS
jgi:hypothetical protein